MMAKSIDELNLMPASQLKGILNQLGVDAPDLDYRKAENKDKLVQLVYDVQQPERPEVEADESAEGEEAKTEATPEDDGKADDVNVDQVLEDLGDFFGGKIQPLDEDEDGVVIFQVINGQGAELESGTFVELKQKKDAEERRQKAQQNALPSITIDEDPQGKLPKVPDKKLNDLRERLKPLQALGLKADIGNHSVRFRFGNQPKTTTLHQPIKLIVRVAESMVKVR